MDQVRLAADRVSRWRVGSKCSASLQQAVEIFYKSTSLSYNKLVFILCKNSLIIAANSAVSLSS